jgi:hypothetical protein
MPAITPEPILKVALGFMAAKYLFAASEIGLFEALARGPANLEELAISHLHCELNSRRILVL